MYAQFKFEWVLFTKNLKNRIVFVLFLAAALYYGLLVAPTYEPLSSFADEDTIKERIEEQHFILEEFRDRPRTIESAGTIIQQSENQLQGLEATDWQLYLESTLWVDNEIRWVRYGPSVDPQFLDVNEDYPEQVEAYWANHTRQRYTYYVGQMEELNPEIIEERTVLQTIQRLLEEDLPLILLLILVLFSIDILTKNKGHDSLFNSVPLPIGTVLFIKTLSTLTGFLLTLVTGTAILLGTIGMRFGIGSFSIPVIRYSFDLWGGYYDWISLGHWLGQSLVLLLLSSLVMIRGILLFSLVIKQELINLIIGVAVLFSENLYYSRGLGYFSSIGLLPPTFFSIGSVLSGYHNFLYNSSDLNFLNGLISLSITWLIIEAVLFLTTQFRYFRRV